MGEHAIGKVAGAVNPPVVNDSSGQPDFPIGTVFGGKQQGHDPKSGGHILAERDAEEIVMNQPAHHPAAPEEFLQDGDHDGGGHGAKQDEADVGLQMRSQGTDGRAGNGVVKEPGMPVSEEQVWRHPDDEDGHADGNAGQRGAGTEREVGPGEGADQRADDEEAHRVQPLGRQRDHALDRHDTDERKKRRNVRGGGAPAGIGGWRHVSDGVLGPSVMVTHSPAGLAVEYELNDLGKGLTTIAVTGGGRMGRDGVLGPSVMVAHSPAGLAVEYDLKALGKVLTTMALMGVALTGIKA